MSPTKAEERRRDHTERVDPRNRERGAMWDEQMQVELHEGQHLDTLFFFRRGLESHTGKKLSAAQNRSRFGLGFASRGDRSSATPTGLQLTPGSAARSSNCSSSSRDRSSGSSSHTFGPSTTLHQVTVEERSRPTGSRSKLESRTTRSRPRHSEGSEQVRMHRRTSGSRSRKRSQRRSRSRSDTSTEHRKNRSRCRISEASYHYRSGDALQTNRRSDVHRDVFSGQNSPHASRGTREVHAGERTGEIRENELGCHEVATGTKGRRKVSVQKPGERRSRSGGTHGSQKRRSPSYSRERSTRERGRSPREDGRSRKHESGRVKSSPSRETGNVRGSRSYSVHGRDEERETRHSSVRAEQDEGTRHTADYGRRREKDGSTASLTEKPEKESTRRFSSCVAACRELGSCANDRPALRSRDARGGGRETPESRRSRARGGSRCREASPHDAGLCTYGNKECKQYLGYKPTVTDVDGCAEVKRQGGIVPGRTAELSSVCHGSAQEAAKQRIRERLREVEQRQGKCSAGESRGISGSGAERVLTAREGRLISWKQLITTESQEAFETDESCGHWNAVLDRQGKERVDEEVQRILEHEDETRFTAFLERKRREKLQAAESRKAAPTAEYRNDAGDADPKLIGLATTDASSSGNNHGEGSHLDAIFGRNAPDSLTRNKIEDKASEILATPCKTALTAADVVTTTLPGLKGVALLADAVVMQSGNSEAGWKLRRQLQRQQTQGQ